MNGSDPIQQFTDWQADARAAGNNLADAMALATTNKNGMPDVRMVMVRSFDQRGFVFYTDRTSAKGNQLRLNPRAMLLAYWQELGRQVRIGGTVEETLPTEDDKAFHSRTLQAQVAITAWRQGVKIGDPDELRAAYRTAEERLQAGHLKRPDRWGGYRLIPSRFVFWQDRSDGMHHRRAYIRVADGTWNHCLLTP